MAPNESDENNAPFNQTATSNANTINAMIDGNNSTTPSRLRAPKISSKIFKEDISINGGSRNNNINESRNKNSNQSPPLKQVKLDSNGQEGGKINRVIGSDRLKGSKVMGGIASNSTIRTFRGNVMTSVNNPHSIKTSNNENGNLMSLDASSLLSKKKKDAKSIYQSNSIGKQNSFLTLASHSSSNIVMNASVVEGWRLRAELAENQNQRLDEKVSILKEENQKLQEELLCIKASSNSSKELEELQEKIEQLQRDKMELIDLVSLNDGKSELEKSKVKSEHLKIVKELQDSLDNLSLEKTKSEQSLLEMENLNKEQMIMNERVQKNLETVLELKNTLLLDSQSQIQIQQNKIQTLDHNLSHSESIIVSLRNQISSLENQIQIGETLRRKLHNEVQELKGNIRVFCRVRPILEKEREREREKKSLGSISGFNSSPSPSSISSTSLNNIEFGPVSRESGCTSLKIHQNVENAMGNTTKKELEFTFDKIFDPSSVQSAVFEEISQLVQSSLDGYRVCIFAYGQTGSGKTFTMEGNSHNQGMIPLAVDLIFHQSSRLVKEKGWNFDFEASYLEIYNETIRDLLVPNDTQSHEIKHVDNKPFVTDLSIHKVDNSNQIMNLLQRASENRAVGETLCNEHSSRSHSVFTLIIRASNPITGESIEGILNLIDLAGSERLSSSGASGARLKETQNINKSLSSLTDVIVALSAGDNHIPYRNSKLTFLLQPSLSGSGSKMLMFVMISPRDEDIGESICSLRFATKVNSCQIGTAKRRTKQ